MGGPPQFFYGQQQGVGQGRRVGADGKIDIKCRICERTICREVYRGYSTAICIVCSGSLDKGMTPQEIMDNVLLEEQKQVEETLTDLGPLQFKVAGIGKRMKDIVQQIRVKATIRRRKPLFDGKDKI